MAEVPDEGAAAEQRAVAAWFGRRDRGREAGGAGADDGDVVALAVGTCGATVAHDLVPCALAFGSLSRVRCPGQEGDGEGHVSGSDYSRQFAASRAREPAFVLAAPISSKLVVPSSK